MRTNLLKAMRIMMVLVLALMLWLMPLHGWAATTNISSASSNYHILTFPLNRQYTATTAGVVRFKMPYPARLVTVQATARASGGTSPTLTVDVQEAGTTVLSSAVSVTAGTVSEATISDPEIADEAVVTVDLTIGGTSPTWDDITVVMVIRRH